MKSFTLPTLIYFIVLLNGCKKMDVRPHSSIVLPATVSDFERLLENDMVTSTPALTHLGGDEYILKDYDTWLSLYTNTQRNAYVWAKDVYAGDVVIKDWDYPYKGILYCNSVLDHISVLKNVEDRNRIEGWALFARAYLFHSLVTTFAGPYNSTIAKSEMGIPLKLNSNIEEVEPRSTLEQTYLQIIQDASKAAGLLNNTRPLSAKNHPSKTAAYSLLARAYLNMSDFVNAEAYVDRALDLFSELRDYNTLDTLAEYPFTYDFDEVIYFSRQIPDYSTSSYGTKETSYGVSKEVLDLYSWNDLRKSLYFIKNSVGNYSIKPINTLAGRPFTGLAVDELYLIKAECLARRNKTDEALAYLDQLVVTRTKTGTYDPIIPTEESVLDVILLERRKSLVWRGLRWVDIKRLNQKGHNIILTRELNGEEFTLPPNDPRYVFPIPSVEISLQ